MMRARFLQRAAMNARILPTRPSGAPGSGQTALTYGPQDKQPESTGWRSGLGDVAAVPSSFRILRQVQERMP
jgi:NADPH-dependent ferric siderophore reductase